MTWDAIHQQWIMVLQQSDRTMFMVLKLERLETSFGFWQRNWSSWRCWECPDFSHAS
jgi:levanase/fructan beta-fructosidase